jgi:hypothetical protein
VASFGLFGLTQWTYTFALFAGMAVVLSPVLAAELALAFLNS